MRNTTAIIAAACALACASAEAGQYKFEFHGVIEEMTTYDEPWDLFGVGAEFTAWLTFHPQAMPTYGVPRPGEFGGGTVYLRDNPNFTDVLEVQTEIAGIGPYGADMFSEMRLINSATDGDTAIFRNEYFIPVVSTLTFRDPSGAALSSAMMPETFDPADWAEIWLESEIAGIYIARGRVLEFSRVPDAGATLGMLALGVALVASQRKPRPGSTQPGAGLPGA